MTTAIMTARRLMRRARNRTRRRFSVQPVMKRSAEAGKPLIYAAGAIVTITYLLVGVLLLAATLPIGTKTFASGK
jgi:hypothetical protein